MIEKAAHRVADLLSCATGKELGFTKFAGHQSPKPLFNRNGFDGAKLGFSPLREDLSSP
jgi:hypothetical protein